MPVYDDCPDPSCQQQNRPAQDEAGRQSPVPHETNGRTSPSMVFNPYFTGRPRTPVGGPRVPAVDRQEIIRRIKSDRSRPTSPEVERQVRAGSKESGDNTGEQGQSSFEVGMQIERPKSALHRGDFRERDSGASNAQDSQTVLSTSPPAPWHPDFSASTFQQAWNERRLGRLQSTPERFARHRLASSTAVTHPFLYQPPTSPLVQSSRPDTPPPLSRRTSQSPDKSRRHTFSPHLLSRLASPLNETKPSNIPKLRKEATYPYQAHQPRRSLHNVLASSPPHPGLSSRRPSGSESHSPLHHSTLVGSYEESILRGRMSTTPSKPLNFIAQIGVLGRGDCKPSLRCPSHVTIPFPAVFYSYPNARQSTNDQPSPYVGLVDLEHDLPSYHDTIDRRRQRLGERLHAAISDEGSRASSRTREDTSSGVDAQAKRIRRQQKAKRRSASPKAPPGGSYRIPQQGQLQIVIKNPNKTAVKLFLVPYDLSDMQPGQKTFIRQRSYSAGPIIDMPMSSRTNLGTDRPEASLSNSDDPNDRPVLRYLIHLHICCTGKGRYWLYKSVRVVFANRVPDGKEKLRNEIQLPEPKYSTYKAGRDGVAHASPPSSPPARRVSDQGEFPTKRQAASSLPSTNFDPHEIASFRFPFRAPLLPTLDSRPSSSHATELMDIDSDQTRSETGPLSPTSLLDMGDGLLDHCSGLDEPLTFARANSRERTEGAGESLISQELRRLDV
ncbi:hypothetical protein AMS68_006693 [Peltaster fructicola]|uniref:Atos-like conserved domain-containing protein n=1 Tax=Peltaster fructicola TaxID=286661 RepID=A0A6H0Y2L2_9PEZI|nr:hypothetical protein AMS68_006693 [Peltaster fructicola]